MKRMSKPTNDKERREKGKKNKIVLKMRPEGDIAD